MSIKIKQNQNGFTLLELLISLAIFALIALITTYGLRHIIDSQRIQQQHNKQLNILQMAHAIIKDDMGSLIDRSIRQQASLEPAVVSATQGVLLNFTRTGFGGADPKLRTSTLQRISYQLKDHQLQRISWLALDRISNTPTTTEILLSNVNHITLRFADNKGQWHDQWPSANTRDILPSAIEMNIQQTQAGNLTWLFLAAQGRNYVTAPD